MSRILLVAVSLVLCSSGQASAQTLRAITQDGKLVILNPDGTWSYADEATQKPDTSGQLKGKLPVDLKRGNYVLWLDEKKWRVDRKQQEADRQTFSHLNGDGYAMAITERVPIPLSTLKRLALDNVKEAAPDARITLDETRHVNGLQVVCLKIAGR